MRNEGYPDLFFGQSAIYHSFHSWPVCPRRIRYRQATCDYRRTRTWGAFTINAQSFGESMVRFFPDKQDGTHLIDRRFIEWLMDADSHSNEILALPEHWWSLGNSVSRYVRAHRCDAFCIQCNRTHGYSSLRLQDDSGHQNGSNYNRLYCPQGHLLLKVETIHILKMPRPQGKSLQSVLRSPILE